MGANLSVFSARSTDMQQFLRALAVYVTTAVVVDH